LTVAKWGHHSTPFSPAIAGHFFLSAKNPAAQ